MKTKARQGGRFCSPFPVAALSGRADGRGPAFLFRDQPFFLTAPATPALAVAWTCREFTTTGDLEGRLIVLLYPTVYMRRSGGLVETTLLLLRHAFVLLLWEKSCLVLQSYTSYEVWINNMHVSMQALPATTRESRALFDDAIRRGRGGRGREGGER